MKKKLGLIVLLAMLILLVAAGCGKKPAPTLYFYNWSEYIDPELFEAFEEEYGIQVIEDAFSNNEDLLAKLQGGGGGYDVIVPSDYMVANMIELGMLAEIDHSKITTFEHLDPLFTDPPYDPGLVHCIPYMWGTTGIGFTWNEFDEAPDSWAYLFDPEIAAEYSGRMTLLDDSRETLGAALIYLGYSPNTTDEAQVQEARDLIIAIKPFVAAFDSDAFDENLLAGETVLAHGYSGDIFQAQLEDENIDYVIPKEGANVWVDNLCIPAEVAEDAERFERALLWIDFLNRPENAAKNVNFIWFATPNKTAASQIDPEILEHPGIYPPDEVFNKLSWLEPLGDFTAFYDRMWTEIAAGQ